MLSISLQFLLFYWKVPLVWQYSIVYVWFVYDDSFLPCDAATLVWSWESVCPSVCHTHALLPTKQCTVDIWIQNERAITLVSWHRLWLVGNAPFFLKFALHPFEKRWLRQISTYNVSAVRGSVKSSIMTNRKSSMGLLYWSMCRAVSLQSLSYLYYYTKKNMHK